jgi:hypothetical protein
MRFRPVPLAVALALVISAVGGCAKVAELDATVKSTGGFFGSSGKQKALSVDIAYSPNPVRLGRSGSMDVTASIVNNTKTQQSFGTQTEQRIAIQVREIGSGRIVATAQEGRTEDPRLTTPLLNPGERLSFERRLSTRDLRAGTTYQIEAFVVGSESAMHGQTQFVPQ